MVGADAGVWRTLVLLYSVVAAAAVCIPLSTVLPLLLGIDSFLLLLVAGVLGLGATGGLASLFVARYDARATEGEHAVSAPTEPTGGHSGSGSG